MKAVVVGGAGFIGSNLVDLLCESDKYRSVVVIDDLSTGKLENVNKKAILVRSDIRNFEEIEGYFGGAEEVYHLAALPRVEPSIKDPLGFNKINVDGALNVFWAAKKHGVKKVIFSSSSSVYGEPSVHPTPEDALIAPMSPYALQKSICEQYAKMFCELYGMNIVCLRYFNVYGNREPTEGFYVPVIGIWLRQYASGEKLTVVGTGKQIRDFVNVGDVARSNVAAAEILNNATGFHTFNVGSGKQYELNEVARWITSDESRISYLPARVEPMLTLASVDKLVCASQGTWRPTVDLKDYIQKQLSEIGK